MLFSKHKMPNIFVKQKIPNIFVTWAVFKTLCCPFSANVARDSLVDCDILIVLDSIIPYNYLDLLEAPTQKINKCPKDSPSSAFPGGSFQEVQQQRFQYDGHQQLLPMSQLVSERRQGPGPVDSGAGAQAVEHKIDALVRCS